MWLAGRMAPKPDRANARCFSARNESIDVLDSPPAVGRLTLVHDPAGAGPDRGAFDLDEPLAAAHRLPERGELAAA